MASVTTAGTIIDNVRDLVPDPVYSAGTPQPDADGGLFRAQTLYRWLDDGIRLMTAATGYTVLDWTAMQAVANRAQYVVDPAFMLIDEAYANLIRARVVNQRTLDNVYPSRGTEPQATTVAVWKMTSQMTTSWWPVPSASDPTTTTNGALSASDTSITVASSAGFLAYGFALIESELVQYQSITGNTLNDVTRGAGGTTAATHASGVAATSCGLWVRGSRSPAQVTSSTSVVEVPLLWNPLLNTYLLAQCRMSENEFQEGARLMQEFEKATQSIAATFAGREPIAESAAQVGRKDLGVQLASPSVADLGGTPLPSRSQIRQARRTPMQ